MVNYEVFAWILESREKSLSLRGGGGLGSAIALQLAAEGASVVIADVSAQAACRTAEAVGACGGHALPLEWDLSRREIFPTLLSQIQDWAGDVDILVNNSGGPPPSLATDVRDELWHGQFDAMVLSLMQLTSLVLPGMRRRGWGRIITSASSGVITPISNLAVSNALRMTLIGWSKTLAAEVAADGVTVNVVLPGRISTARIAQLDQARADREKRSLDDVICASTSSIPARRYGKPEEYADAVTFLASARASYITGSMVRVDGGLIPNI